MKFIVSTQDLLHHLKSISGVIVSKPLIPIIDNFLFDIKGNKLTITATDLETTMSTILEVESDENVKLAVPSKMLLDFLSAMGNQPVTFTVKENNIIELASNVGRYKLAGFNGDDFPQTMAMDSANSFDMAANILLRGVSKTLFATSNDDMRKNFTGVYFEMFKDKLNLVATDANRLVRFTRTDIKPGAEGGFIVPKKALNLLKNSLPNADDTVKVDFNDTNVFFSFKNVKLICRLIDQKFPDYDNVIPKNNDKTLMVNARGLQSAVKRISIFSNKVTHQLRFAMAGSELTVSAEDIDLSNEGSEKLPCEYDGEDMHIGFNGKYLAEIISYIDNETAKLQFTVPSRAGLVLPSENEENEEILMLIMPMMLNDVMQKPAPEPKKEEYKAEETTEKLTAETQPEEEGSNEEA